MYFLFKKHLKEAALMPGTALSSLPMLCRHSFNFQAPRVSPERYNSAGDDLKRDFPLKGINRHPSCNI